MTTPTSPRPRPRCGAASRPRGGGAEGGRRERDRLGRLQRQRAIHDGDRIGAGLAAVERGERLVEGGAPGCDLLSRSVERFVPAPSVPRGAPRRPPPAGGK